MNEIEIKTALEILKAEGEEIQINRAGSTEGTLIVVCHYRTFIVRKTIPPFAGATYWHIDGFFFEIIK